MNNLAEFISQNVIKRPVSLFVPDIERYRKELTEKIEGKTFLVIGGAGSIGASFIKAILPFHPSALVVVDTNENGLAELTRDIRSSSDLSLPRDYLTYPMDFASPVFRKMFVSRNGFDVVANFSAHKHVRSEKDIFSVEALLRNNVLNARKLLELLEEYPPEEFFCVSTDKAANPVNIMGASKRILEDLIFDYSDLFAVKTARFANVAFSNGSLPAGFLARIGNLQPLSAPNDVKRYFVSPEESGQICMLSCMLGNNREIFFPKLDDAQMMKFSDIAVDLLHSYGYDVLECGSEEEAIRKAKELTRGSSQYPVYFSASDTSGEKSFEEFYTSSETVDMDRFYSLGVITDKEKTDSEKLNRLLADLDRTFCQDTYAKADIVALIEAYLPNFKHIETGKSLDSKM